jgi:hypothetical protein
LLQGKQQNTRLRGDIIPAKIWKTTNITFTTILQLYKLCVYYNLAARKLQNTRLRRGIIPAEIGKTTNTTFTTILQLYTLCVYYNPAAR